MRGLWAILTVFLCASSVTASLRDEAMRARESELTERWHEARRQWDDLKGRWPDGAENLIMTADLRRDHLDAAIDVMLEILSAYGPDARRLENLAVAVALVHDVNLKRTVNGRVTRADDPIRLFGYFRDLRRRGAKHLEVMRPEMLMFLVDSTAAISDMRWAAATYSPKDAPALYRAIQYDRRRLAGERDTGSYTLRGVLARGGVCADRAWFATHVAKAVGLPSLHMRAEGSGETHAWFVYLDGGRWQHSGRTKDFAELAGSVRSPQTGRLLSETELEMLSGSVSREHRLEALAHVEQSGGIGRLLKRAIDLDRGCLRAWAQVKETGWREPKVWLEIAAKLREVNESFAAELILSLAQAFEDERRLAILEQLGHWDLNHDLAMQVSIERAKLLQSLGRMEEALETCRTAMQQHGNSGKGAARMATVWCDILERQNRALDEMYETALSAMPDFSERDESFRRHTTRYLLEREYAQWKQGADNARF